jgi:glycosyltransferase involved in cell wall biosynthesis
MAVKLVIQIPCYNEEEALPATIRALPARVEGVDRIEILIVDDGSTDRTADVARELGVHHIVRSAQNQGLARAFMRGLEASLAAGADIIVNTDADNQYCADDIPKLIQPILSGKAEIVIGERPIAGHPHFSPVKKLLQGLGSQVVRLASKTSIPDCPSGFRAISRHAALHLNVFSKYSYTLEMIIQAGRKGIPITSVPVRVNANTRPSRLVKSVPNYVLRSMFTIVRIFILYRPMFFFFSVSVVPLAAGVLLLVRWLVLYLLVDPTRVRAPSLIAAAILCMLGFLGLAVAILADLLAANRTLLEEIRVHLRARQVEDAGQNESR